MKSITNQAVAIREQGRQLTYADLIRFACNSKADGFTIDEMRRRFRILDVVEKAGPGAIELEDADVVVLKNCVAHARWVSLHRDIMSFGELVAAL